MAPPDVAETLAQVNAGMLVALAFESKAIAALPVSRETGRSAVLHTLGMVTTSTSLVVAMTSLLDASPLPRWAATVAVLLSLFGALAIVAIVASALAPHRSAWRSYRVVAYVAGLVCWIYIAAVLWIM